MTKYGWFQIAVRCSDLRHEFFKREMWPVPVVRSGHGGGHRILEGQSIGMDAGGTLPGMQEGRI
jgi:hypothetical protein